MPLVTIADGEVLTVTAEAGGGTVQGEGHVAQWAVKPGAPVRLGRPGVYRLEGNVTHSVDGQAVAVLAATLPRATEIIKSARIVASAIVGSGSVSMQDKFKRLAERARTVPRVLSDRADVAFTRLDAIELRGDTTFGGLESVLTDVEGGIGHAEDALNQITNGAPVDPN